MSGTIDYGNLMHRAMRGLIHQVLTDVAQNGLPGDHHFFITFDTTHQDVDLADWLRERYPDEMTVVMQNWFDKLEVDEDGFSITLNFGDAPERMRIPYDSIRTFVDPSVEFGLRFETQDTDGDDDIADDDDDSASDIIAADPSRPLRDKDKKDLEQDPAKNGHMPGDVVQLDNFRK